MDATGILADACPVCPPGIPDASLPIGPVLEVNGGRVADYQCSSCETAWSAFFDRWGFPIDRLIAPVTSEQAGRHRNVLAEALRSAA
jgi:hypothetical protein